MWHPPGSTSRALDAASHVLLTGGTGFFGKALLRHWAALPPSGPPRVDVLSRNPAAFLERNPEFHGLPWLTLRAADILRPETLPADGVPFTHLLHAAADSTAAAALTPLDVHVQIVEGTRNLLAYAAANGIRRFLLTSSGGAYGPQPPHLDRIPEDYHGMPDPLQVGQAYGVAKRMAEQLCALYGHQHGLEVVVARCFAFVGRDLPRDAHFAIGNFIRDALAAPAITVNGDGAPIRSYMDQRDLASWLVALLERGRPGHAYNVGSEAGITIRELAHLVRDLLAPGKTVHVAASGAPTIRNRYLPSTQKARTELGVALAVPLESAIVEAARFPPPPAR